MNFDQLKINFVEKGFENKGESNESDEKDPALTSLSIFNGVLLMFATKRKIYSFGLSLTDESYMEIEEICEHECER
ncbi:hypothetical protein MTR_3g070037 [Medicago truncatula]|uniref:Uncharacterized protein n=1 Tax=Medicago truncatula TaxID=3880 RepID=A0A072UY97_MEDTR|nr:hypothetical protein MTR_3g070037 [Medicago truncatula]